MQQPPTKERQVTPARFAVIDADGNYLRRPDGTIARVLAFTRKSAKHTVRRQFGPGYEVGQQLT